MNDVSENESTDEEDFFEHYGINTKETRYSDYSHEDQTDLQDD